MFVEVFCVYLLSRLLLLLRRLRLRDGWRLGGALFLMRFSVCISSAASCSCSAASASTTGGVWAVHFFC